MAADATAVTELDQARLRVTVLTPRLARIGWSSSGSWPDRRPWAVTRPDDDFAPADVRREDDVDGTTLSTDDLAVSITPGGLVSVRTADGHEIARTLEPPSFDEDAHTTRWPIHMPPDRRYYGFGERTGLLEKRGRRFTCWTTDEWEHQGATTDAMYIAVPFHLGLDPGGIAHGIYLDTTWRSSFDLTGVDSDRLLLEAATDTLDWYVLLGPSPAGVVEAFSELVGRATLPPRWAFGYHQARFSYTSDEEMRATASALRDLRIPADVVHFDIHHYDRFRPFTWDRERFPDPKRLIADLAAMDLRTTAVVDAALPISRGYRPYDEARRRDFLIRRSRDANAALVTGYVWGGRSAYPDQLRADVRAWWGDLHRQYVDAGIAGFVNDMNEPSMRASPIEKPGTETAEPPPDAPMGDPGLGATHAEVRNLYARSMNQATDAYLRRVRPSARPFVVSRSGFAGVQRDALSWTGDNWSTWEHLEMSIPQLLNMGLSGIPFAGADIGGFFDACTPELLVRWTQLGALYPFARNNSATGTPRQEPWAWGEPTLSRCRRAIELRYRLLPYLYTQAEAVARTGVPMFRPLFLEFPGDERAQLTEDEALIGPALLVAPVVRPGRTAREVYLPPGGWFDMRDGRDGRPYAGGRSHLVSATLDEDVPLFARAGSVIPMAPVTQSTRERPDRLDLHVWPSGDVADCASGELYEDDGETTAHLEGDWRRTRFIAMRDGDGWALESPSAGTFDPGPRRMQAVIHEPADAPVLLDMAGAPPARRRGS